MSKYGVVKANDDLIDDSKIDFKNVKTKVSLPRVISR